MLYKLEFAEGKRVKSRKKILKERGEKMYTVVEGMEQDIGSWMELVKSVRWNFPGLETESALQEHRDTVLKFMEQKRAICVKDGKRIVGVLLFSCKYNMICCLAVSEKYGSEESGANYLPMLWKNWTEQNRSQSQLSEKKTKKELLQEPFIKNLVLCRMS